MPPNRTVSPTPTISQIYGAFDEASHTIFRRAMRRSKGGVVRVADLATALADVVPDICRGVFPPRLLVVPAAVDPQDVPMANEPALRDLLRQALLLGAEQRGVEEPAITPAVLVAALALRNPLYRVRPLAEVFQTLGLVLPPGFQPSPELVPCHWASPVLRHDRSSAHVPAEVANIEGLVLDILEKWLDAQDLPSGEARGKKLEVCASLASGLKRVTMVPSI